MHKHSISPTHASEIMSRLHTSFKKVHTQISLTLSPKQIFVLKATSEQLGLGNNNKLATEFIQKFRGVAGILEML